MIKFENPKTEIVGDAIIFSHDLVFGSQKEKDEYIKDLKKFELENSSIQPNPNYHSGGLYSHN